MSARVDGDSNSQRSEPGNEREPSSVEERLVLIELEMEIDEGRDRSYDPARSSPSASRLPALRCAADHGAQTKASAAPISRPAARVSVP